MRPLIALLTLAAATSAIGSGIPVEETTRVGAAGVSVALPRGWHHMPQAVVHGTPTRDPVTRLVVASSPIGFGRGCNELDYRFAKTGVAFVVVEWVRLTPGVRWSPRPSRFTARNLPIRPPPALECVKGPGGGIQFSEHGRRFAAFLLVGSGAPAALVARARAVLDTLRVRRRT